MNFRDLHRSKNIDDVLIKQLREEDDKKHIQDPSIGVLKNSIY